MENITVRPLPDSKIEITGDISASDFTAAWNEAVNVCAKKASLPGFRPGNIPESVLLSRIGENTILHEAAQIALRKAYGQIVTEQKIEAIGQPEVIITKLARGNPLGFKLVTAVLPEAALPEYKTIAKEVFSKKETVTVEDKEVADALERLRASRGQKQEDGATGPLPELNDAFAKEIGNFTTLKELQQAVRDNIRFEKELKQREELRSRALAAIADKTTVVIPKVLADAERDKMIAQLKSQLSGIGLSWEQYLTQIKKNEEELRREWESEGERRARYGLVLRALIKAEQISPTEQELQDTVAEIKKQQGGHAKVDETRSREYAYGIVINEKVFQCLEEQATQVST